MQQEVAVKRPYYGCMLTGVDINRRKLACNRSGSEMNMIRRRVPEIPKKNVGSVID